VNPLTLPEHDLLGKGVALTASRLLVLGRCLA
jgi:hypothetical protein